MPVAWRVLIRPPSRATSPTDNPQQTHQDCSTEGPCSAIEVFHPRMAGLMNFPQEPGLQVRVFDDQARDSCWQPGRMDVAEPHPRADENSTAKECRSECCQWLPPPAMDY